MEVFNNRLLSITEDMGNILIRSSFSTNIKERRDCSVGLFDARGRLIAQGSHVPLHLGSLLGSVEAVLERYTIDAMLEGDAYILNDPYMAGGTHMPDISIVTPVFRDGAVRFFTANIGHHSDVGGSVPGSISGTARSIFEEGLRIPVIRIQRAGEIDVDLMYLIVNNTREPEERELDLKVQIATNERGAAMVHELVGQMGLEAVERSIEDILTYTRRRLRNRIAELRDGDYSFTSYMDDDGMGGDVVPIRATVRVAGEGLTVDFTGSGAQARGAMNVAKSALRATVFYCVKALMDPGLMPNSGMFDAIAIDAPLGTITNPRFPAPVGARSITCNKVARAIIGAFEGLLPKGKGHGRGSGHRPRHRLFGPARQGGGHIRLPGNGGRRRRGDVRPRRHGCRPGPHDQHVQPSGRGPGARILPHGRRIRPGRGFGRRRHPSRRPRHRAPDQRHPGRRHLLRALRQPRHRLARRLRRWRRPDRPAGRQPRLSRRGDPWLEGLPHRP